ncbi:MAG: hypothetical protein K8L99_13060 [Anaerolineae bacterium]|nr:hypothetical protein [Anaerolineae bacterium]
MPVNTLWDNDEKTIIRVENEGHWTWEEFHHALENIVKMIESVDHHVDIINIDRPGASMPISSPIQHFQRAAQLFAPYSVLNINVISSPFARMLTKVLAGIPVISSPYVKHVESLEEAYALIEADRAKNSSAGTTH